MHKQVDIAIVGAGILGLAHAWHAVRAGMSVRVFERDHRAMGASIQNFGMLAIIAQKSGTPLRDAQRALQYWRELADEAGIALRQTGCLFVAREAAELALLDEYSNSPGELADASKLLPLSKLTEIAPWLNRDTLLGGLWSPDAWKVDQQNAVAAIARWLQLKMGVTFHFGEEVLGAAAGHLQTNRGDYRVGHTIVCGGSEFSTLYPQAFAATGVVPCRLQMLSMGPQPTIDQLAPFVLGGLSMTRYDAFTACDALSALKDLQRRKYPEYLGHGIHVIASQELDGSITIGDSHHYGHVQEDARLDRVDQLILAELDRMLNLPHRVISRRWLGHYAHHPDTDLLKIEPADGVTAITVTNGQGMTHGLTIAADVVAALDGGE